MQVIAVPVKALHRAKSRLAPLLRPAERESLALAMLEDVLDVCLAQPGWETWVVSPDARALALASERSARPVQDRGRSLLEAVRQVEALSLDPSRLAVVLADLPLASAGALAEVLGRPGPVVAVPAASDGGTNVIVRRPAQVIPARFGRGSFARHRRAAERAGVAFEELPKPDLAFDLDTPGDVAGFLATGRRGRTRTVCLDLALPDRLLDVARARA